MKRREFIVNSALMLSLPTIVSGCNQKYLEKSKAQVVRRTFKDTTLPIIALGGLFSYPIDKQDISQKDFDKIIAKAMNAGMNYFDMTYLHSSETIFPKLAKALKKYPRESYILANKISVYQVKKKKDIEQTLDSQLKIFNTDYFDNYMVSNIVSKNIENYYKKEIHNEVLRLKNQGKIKNIGFSGPQNPHVFEKVLNEGWDYCEIKMNYYDWEERGTKEIHRIANEKNTPIIISQVLREGTLTSFPKIIEQKIKNSNPNETQASFALRWAASQKGIVCLLCDIDTQEQVQENIEIFSNYQEYNENDYKNLKEIKEYIKTKELVKCFSCKHCNAVCPREIDIAGIFTLYNNYKLDSEEDRNKRFLESYNKIAESKKAHNCINCNACADCKLGTDIPKTLKEIDEIIKRLENA